MFEPRRVFTLHIITTKALIVIVLALIVGSIFTLLTFPRALAATILSENRIKLPPLFRLVNPRSSLLVLAHGSTLSASA